MKHLKSSLSDLRKVFDQGISGKYLAEPLVSFDVQHNALQALEYMERMDFNVVGVTQDGLVDGYVDRIDLKNGTLAQYRKPFENQFLVDEEIPLLAVLDKLSISERLFTSKSCAVQGIITKGDLQKVPVRMWLFGVLSLLEMQLLRLIRESYPEDTWRPNITSGRLAKAEALLLERQRRNEAIDLADCLELCDKSAIVLANEHLRQGLGFTSKSQGQECLNKLQRLRNGLAHAQDIVTGNWPDMVTFAKKAEALLASCERLDIEDMRFVK